jgi:hypothetical protein
VLLFRLRDPTKLDQCPPPRLIRRHAVLPILFNGELKVRGYLRVELSVPLLPMQKGGYPLQCFPPCAH